MSVLPDALRDFLGRLQVGGDLGGVRGRSTPITEPIPANARFLDGSFANEFGSRTYKLYVPSTYQGHSMPLVVMLHGCTQSPDDFAAGTQMNKLAEEHGCLVVYPAQSSSANISRCWNWFNAQDQHRDRGEPALIAGITRQVMDDYAVDPQRVFIAGLSAGGAAAAVMAATYPDLYAAVGVHSGLAHGAATDMPSALAAMRSGGTVAAQERRSGRLVPTIVFHGDQDSTVHPRNGDQVIAQARISGPAGLQPTATVLRGQAPGGRSFSRTLHADPDGRSILEQWVIHGAGHAWAGGSTAGSYTDPEGPDAGREMLRFFLANPHPDVARSTH
ncbi:MAG: PHB depolymerase family esterase [Geminicoccaceae bacterium]